MTEHNHQKLTVAWFRKNYPHLAGVFFAIPNGGKRDPITAARLKEEGVVQGVPDLFLAVPVGGKAGLWLEMKDLKGSAKKAQKDMHAALVVYGYAVEVARGYEAAKLAIANYLVPSQGSTPVNAATGFLEPSGGIRETNRE